jgi:hypothetical protein
MKVGVCPAGYSRRTVRRKAGVRRSQRVRGGPHGSRGPGRRNFASEIDGVETDAWAESGWVEWGGELVWAVEFAAGGAPIGLAASDFNFADLHALGLDADAVALMKPGDQGVGGLDVWFEEVDAE